MIKKFTHEVWNLHKKVYTFSQKNDQKVYTEQTGVNRCKLSAKFTQICPPMCIRMSTYSQVAHNVAAVAMRLAKVQVVLAFFLLNSFLQINLNRSLIVNWPFICYCRWEAFLGKLCFVHYWKVSFHCFSDEMVFTNGVTLQDTSSFLMKGTPPASPP